MNNTFLIPEANLADLEKKVAQINRKASKLATPPVTITRTGVVKSVATNVGGSIAHRLGGQGQAVRYTYKAVEVIVQGSAPVIEGWEFVAIIRHKLTENQFVQVPGTEECDLSDYTYSPKNCDHCHKNRVRNASYVVRNVNTNELMQVGSTCLSDFTGWNDPQQAAKAAENIWKLFHEHIPSYRIVPRTSKSFHIEEWMAFVAQAVREHGWLSRANSYGSGDATADRAKVAIIDYYEDKPVTAPTTEDFTTAREMIAWAHGDAHTDMSESDFKDNLLAAFAPEYITEDAMGTTAAVFAAKARVDREKAKLTVQANQGYIGTKGDKITVEVTCERHNTFEGGYGWVTAYNFTDGTNKLVWFASSSQGIEDGDKIKLTGTVKAHKVDNYTGDKQTILTRCKVAVTA